MVTVCFFAVVALLRCLVQNVAARPHAGFTGQGAAADSAATAGTNPAGITRFDANIYQLELYTIDSSSTWEGQLGEMGRCPVLVSRAQRLCPPAIW